MVKLTMTRLWTMLVMVAVMLVAQPAFADFLPEEQADQQDASSLEMVERYLASLQGMSSRLELRKYSRDPVVELEALASGRRVRATIRARAVQALALYRGDERVPTMMERLLTSMRPGDKIFPAVVVAYGEVVGEDGAETLGALINHERDEVRMAAVVALGRFGGEQGVTLLQLRLADEEHEVIRARIASYL